MRITDRNQGQFSKTRRDSQIPSQLKYSQEHTFKFATF